MVTIEEGCGVSLAIAMYAFFYSVKLIWCSGVAYIYGQLEEGGGVSLRLVYVHSAICETYLV